jgi:SUMO ligase MMS21 Smc5/6 complex component
MKKLVNEKNVKQHKKWREFRQRVWAVHHAGEPLPEEDELLEEAGGVMIGSDDTVQTTCPITRQFLERPMKNKLCGHVYSHDAVQDYMKKGGATCPVAGCSKRVSARSLEPDIELERELVKIRKQKKTTRGTQADDVDLEL